MDSKRIAAFLLGAWILGSLFMIFVATQNFATADRMGQTASDEASRQLLHRMAGQENQLFFVNWERTELLLGIALAGVLIFAAGARLTGSLAGIMLLIAAAQHFAVTPQMLSLSTHLDDAAQASQFGKLHAIYGVMEVLKLVVALALAALVLPEWRYASTPRARKASSINAISSSRVM